MTRDFRRASGEIEMRETERAYIRVRPTGIYRVVKIARHGIQCTLHIERRDFALFRTRRRHEAEPRGIRSEYPSSDPTSSVYPETGDVRAHANPRFIRSHWNKRVKRATSLSRDLPPLDPVLASND